MIELRSILLPVDFSERSIGAAQYAKALAFRFRSEVHVVHVIDMRVCGLYGLGNDYAAAREFAPGYLKGAEREIQRFLADMQRDLKIKRVLLYGDPAHEIVHYAGSEKSDLIVLPTHGHGPFRRFLLGSVTAKVLHDADCPIWTGVHMEHAAEIESAGFRRILCALNPRDTNHGALAWAWNFGRDAGGKVKIVHALPPIYAADSPHFGKEMKEIALRAAEAEIREAQKSVGSDAEVEIVAGETHTAACAVATDWNADLMVIGRGVAADFLGRLRSRSYTIIRESPCPVVSV
jgi:nucleotide-binding universal stress UspA family protein